MKFTYDSYIKLLTNLQEHRYTVCSYTVPPPQKCVILRHNIDNNLEKALKFAKLEQSMGVCSTYFVLLTSDFYNVFSYKSTQLINAIAELGHNIGLHFDEIRYPEIKDVGEIADKIQEETNILSHALGLKINTVSMHRPSKAVLNADLKIPGIINSYGKMFFEDFKYLSDSRRRWREPVEEIVNSEKYSRLHILTHAFWYNDVDKSIKETIRTFVNHANIERFETMQENITDIEAIMKKNEVLS